MANEILVQFKPQGHKELIRAIERLATAQKKLNGSMKKTNITSTQAAKKSGLLDANHKRLAATNGMLANSFATIRSKMLLWSFAMSMGIKQIVDMGKSAAVLEGMETAFGTLSGGAENASISLDKLREATNNTMSDFNLFQQANNAMILGVSKNSDEMAEMFDIAQRLGRALGKDTAHSVESLITGIGRQSRLMLDNIGIIVKAEEAYEAYAKKLGISADDLTDVQRKQAFLAATMESARKKVLSLGDEVLSITDSYNQLGTSLEQLKKRVGDAFNAFEPLIKVSKDFLDAITDERIDRFIRAIGLIKDVFIGLASVLAVLIIPPLLAFVGVGGTIGAIGTAISGSWILSGLALLGTSYSAVALRDSFKDLTSRTEELTEEQKRLNKEFKEGADTLIDLDIGSSFETWEVQMLQYGSSVETVTDAIKAQLLVNQLYPKTQQAQLEFLNSQIELLERVREEIEITKAFEDVLESLIAKRDKLKGSIDENTNGVEEEISARQRLLGVLTEEQQKKVELAQATLQIGQEVLNQFDGMTSAMSKQVNTRMNNELTSLKETEKYQKASSKRKKNMEKDVSEKYAAE